jgi:hypothetical protein
MFDQLLGAAVEQADVGIDSLDHLPIEFEHEAKNTVRRRMLRSEINGEVALPRRAQNGLRSIGAMRRGNSPVVTPVRGVCSELAERPLVVAVLTRLDRGRNRARAAGTGEIPSLI